MLNKGPHVVKAVQVLDDILQRMASMVLAALGYLPPVAGPVMQEVIDVLAVVNALRVALPPKTLTDY